MDLIIFTAEYDRSGVWADQRAGSIKGHSREGTSDYRHRHSSLIVPTPFRSHRRNWPNGHCPKIWWDLFFIIIINFKISLTEQITTPMLHSVVVYSDLDTVLAHHRDAHTRSVEVYSIVIIIILNLFLPLSKKFILDDVQIAQKI